MPYTPLLEKQRGLKRIRQRAKETIEKETKKIIKKYKEDSNKLMEKATEYAFEEIYTEAVNMYDAYIDKYYSYSTKVYVRHGESKAGTRKGHNLYSAKEFDINYANLLIDVNNFEPDNMDSYYNTTPEQVFEVVSNGHRGVQDPSRPERYKSWSYTYDGKYYNSEDKTIKEAFDEFEDSFSELYFKIRNLFYIKGNEKLNKDLWKEIEQLNKKIRSRRFK